MDYLPTVIVGLIIASIVVAIIVKGIINIKKGKGSCGCGCSECALSDMCHKEK